MNMRVVSSLLIVASGGSALAAPSLPVTGPPVSGAPTGPGIDPGATPGQ